MNGKWLYERDKSNEAFYRTHIISALVLVGGTAVVGVCSWIATASDRPVSESVVQCNGAVRMTAEGVFCDGVRYDHENTFEINAN